MLNHSIKGSESYIKYIERYISIYIYIHTCIQQVRSEGDQPWDFFGGDDAEAETPVLWPPHAKSCLFGKDSDAERGWGQEEKGMTEDEMAGRHHRLVGHEFGWTLGVGDGQGGLACCDSWGHKESDTNEWLNWTVLKITVGSDCSHEIRRRCFLAGKWWQTFQCVEK